MGCRNPCQVASRNTFTVEAGAQQARRRRGLNDDDRRPAREQQVANLVQAIPGRSAAGRWSLVAPRCPGIVVGGMAGQPVGSAPAFARWPCRVAIAPSSTVAVAGLASIAWPARPVEGDICSPGIEAQHAGRCDEASPRVKFAERPSVGRRCRRRSRLDRQLGTYWPGHVSLASAETLLGPSALRAGPFAVARAGRRRFKAERRRTVFGEPRRPFVGVVPVADQLAAASARLAGYERSR